MTIGGTAGIELEIFAHARNWKAYWSSQLAPYVGRTVLEVGAGLAESTPFLITPGVERWVCLEPHAPLAQRVRTRLEAGRLPPVCTLKEGTVADLDAGDLFDTVLYIDVLEHIEDDAAEMSRAAEHVVEGGFLCVLVPAHQHLYSTFDRAIGHFRRYDRASLSVVMGDDLECAELRYLDSVGYLASLGNRLMLRQGLPTHRQIRIWDRFAVRASRLLDPVLGFRHGRSLLGVWRRRNGPVLTRGHRL